MLVLLIVCTIWAHQKMKEKRIFSRIVFLFFRRFARHLLEVGDSYRSHNFEAAQTTNVMFVQIKSGITDVYFIYYFSNAARSIV